MRESKRELDLGLEIVRVGLLGCAIITAPVWLPIWLASCVAGLAEEARRRATGWYGEAWVGDEYQGAWAGDRSWVPALGSVGQSIRSPDGSPFAVTKDPSRLLSDPRRSNYRVRPKSGRRRSLTDRGPVFFVASAEILEVIPAWIAYGPRGDELETLLNAAKALPSDRYRTFVADVPDPHAVLARLPGPGHDAAENISWIVYRELLDEKVEGAALRPDNQSSALMITDKHWADGVRAVTLAAIGLVMGPSVESTEGDLGRWWQALRGDDPFPPAGTSTQAL